jgi:hypothetical protein
MPKISLALLEMCTLLQVFTDMFVDYSLCTDSDQIPSMADRILWIHSHGILNNNNKVVQQEFYFSNVIFRQQNV